jgi:hypothetical protein
MSRAADTIHELRFDDLTNHVVSFSCFEIRCFNISEGKESGSRQAVRPHLPLQRMLVIEGGYGTASCSSRTLGISIGRFI